MKYEQIHLNINDLPCTEEMEEILMKTEEKVIQSMREQVRWIKSEENLPLTKLPVLGMVQIGSRDMYANVMMQVTFSPTKGWKIANVFGDLHIEVCYWRQLPKGIEKEKEND